MRSTHTLVLTAAILSASSSIAQLPTVDITLAHNRPGQTEVRIRPDAYFDGLLAAIVFTVRWETASGASIYYAMPGLQTLSHMSIGPSGPPIVSGPYTYEIFAGVMIDPLYSIGVPWVVGHEQTICTINMIGDASTVELVNDPVTNANNGDYYVSLNGNNQTGTFFTSPEPEVDIRAYTTSGTSAAVAVTPHENYFGMVNHMGFTLRWDAASGASLGNVVQPGPVLLYLPITKSGPEVVDGAYRYQRFEGAGDTSIANAGAAWIAGQEHPLFSISATAPITDLVVASDAWTAANNGEYAIGLNGNDHTGTITAIPDATTAGANMELFAIVQEHVLQVNVSGATPGRTELRLIAPNGAVVWSGALQATNSRAITSIDMTGRSAGIYVLHASSDDHCAVARVAYDPR